MPIAKDFTFKTLVSAAPQELVSFSYGGGSMLAIVLDKLDAGKVLYGVLTANDPDFPTHPFYTVTEPSGHCLSYGTDWELQLHPTDATYSGNAQYRDQPGVIHVDDKSTVLRFGASPERRTAGALEFDLDGWQRASVLQEYRAPIVMWKVWARAGMSSARNVRPLFEFGKPA